MASSPNSMMETAHDTVNRYNQDHGTVTGPTAKLSVNFTDYLLLEAIPQVGTPTAQRH